jgi:hypothetical protein
VSLLPGWARFSSWTCDPRLSPWISMLKWSNFGWCGGSHHVRKPPYCGKYQERFLAIVDDFMIRLAIKSKWWMRHQSLKSGLGDCKLTRWEAGVGYGHYCPTLDREPRPMDWP